jgi:hypothetical protein
MATKSEAAGKVAKFIAEYGVGKLADLGDAARKAAEGNTKAQEQAAVLQKQNRDMYVKAAEAFGLNEARKATLVNLATTSGPAVARLLGDLLRNGAAEGLRSALDAYARLREDLGGKIPGYKAINERLNDDTGASKNNIPTWRAELRDAFHRAQTWAEMPERAVPGSGAQRILKAFAKDWDHLRTILGPQPKP